MATSIQLATISTVFDPDLRIASRAARAAGFAGLQLEAKTQALDLTTLSTTGQRELRHVLSSQNLQVSSLRLEMGNKGFGPTADIDAALARLDAVMAVARPLGAAAVCVDIGPLPAPEIAAKTKSVIPADQLGLILIPAPTTAAPMEQAARPLDQVFAASVDSALAELGHRADRYGAIVAYRTDLASFAALDRALKAARCPWFGIDLDPVATLRDEWPVDEIFSILGGQIRHIRGRDAIAGADRRAKPCAIGEGSIDWGELLANVDSAGFNGWMSVDPLDLADRTGAAMKANEYLGKLLARQ
jgi:sugar phosphate isomerase/epimerase